MGGKNKTDRGKKIVYVRDVSHMRRLQPSVSIGLHIIRERGEDYHGMFMTL